VPRWARLPYARSGSTLSCTARGTLLRSTLSCGGRITDTGMRKVIFITIAQQASFEQFLRQPESQALVELHQRKIAQQLARRQEKQRNKEFRAQVQRTKDAAF
jgi:hypothetical protein